MKNSLLPIKKPIKRILDGKMITINSMIHYAGTEEYAIELVEGFGPFSNTERLVISEHEIDSFINQFEIQTKKQLIQTNDMETQKAEVIENNKDNFNEVRSILFETMRGLKDGSVKPDVAKQISETAQTIINTVKVELDYVKISGDNHKPKMLS